MDRREAIGAVGAFTLAALSAASRAESMPAHNAPVSKAAALGAAASQCVLDGQRCLAHCLFLLGNGDDSMADCSKAVNQMLACCTALQSLAAQDSQLLPGMAKVALDACTECEKACKKHNMHAPCRACMESCAECIKQCRAFAA
jgi:Cys-rich four helix bundle protein (predicted Tat secretion target)